MPATRWGVSYKNSRAVGQLLVTPAPEGFDQVMSPITEIHSKVRLKAEDDGSSRWLAVPGQAD